MGNILFIRVSACTYAEKVMFKTWPVLCRLAFPEDKTIFTGEDEGVLALISNISDGIRFSLFPEDKVKNLTSHSKILSSLKKGLEESLADQNVARAKKLTNDIEDALDNAEKAVS